ncbi:MAG: hypothetical protein R3C05_10630 [Pirellulaceae bacterium]
MKRIVLISPTLLLMALAGLWLSQPIKSRTEEAASTSQSELEVATSIPDFEAPGDEKPRSVSARVPDGSIQQVAWLQNSPSIDSIKQSYSMGPSLGESAQGVSLTWPVVPNLEIPLMSGHDVTVKIVVPNSAPLSGFKLSVGGSPEILGAPTELSADGNKRYTVVFSNLQFQRDGDLTIKATVDGNGERALTPAIKIRRIADDGANPVIEGATHSQFREPTATSPTNIYKHDTGAFLRFRGRDSGYALKAYVLKASVC